MIADVMEDESSGGRRWEVRNGIIAVYISSNDNTSKAMACAESHQGQVHAERHGCSFLGWIRQGDRVCQTKRRDGTRTVWPAGTKAHSQQAGAMERPCDERCHFVSPEPQWWVACGVARTGAHPERHADSSMRLIVCTWVKRVPTRRWPGLEESDPESSPQARGGIAQRQLLEVAFCFPCRWGSNKTVAARFWDEVRSRTALFPPRIYFSINSLAYTRRIVGGQSPIAIRALTLPYSLRATPFSCTNFDHGRGVSVTPG